MSDVAPRSSSQRPPALAGQRLRAARWSLALFAFAVPPALLLGSRALGRPDGFLLSGYVVPAVLELLLIALLEVPAVVRMLTPGRLRMARFLAHTVCGLPATAILAVAAPVAEAALIRQLAVLALLGWEGFRWKQILLHQLLFLVGVALLAAPALRGSSKERLVLLFSVQCVATMLALGLLLLTSRFGRLHLSTLFHLHRAERRSRRQDSQLKAIARAVLPPEARSAFLNQQPAPVWSGSAVCIVLDCSGRHRAAEHFVRHARSGARAGMRSFQGEWERFLDFAARTAQESGFFVVRDSSRPKIVRRLTDPEREGLPQTRVLLEGVLLARQLSDFAARSNKALLASGSLGWEAPATVELLTLHGCGGAPRDPGWQLFGEQVDAAEDFLRQLPEDGGPARVWIPTVQFDAVRPLFAERDQITLGERTAPAFLRERYSVDGRGVEPLPGLADRLGLLL